MMIVLIGGVMFASSNGQSLLLPGHKWGQILMGRIMITLASLCHYHQMAKPWLSGTTVQNGQIS